MRRQFEWLSAVAKRHVASNCRRRRIRPELRPGIPTNPSRHLPLAAIGPSRQPRGQRLNLPVCPTMAPEHLFLLAASEEIPVEAGRSGKIIAKHQ
jgi:hypothetical protein